MCLTNTIEGFVEPQPPFNVYPRKRIDRFDKMTKVFMLYLLFPRLKFLSKVCYSYSYIIKYSPLLLESGL